MSELSADTVQLDSLIANEFAFEIEGDKVSGIFTINGLHTYATNTDGERIKPPFIVTKMVQRDGNLAFNRWLQETIDARDSDDNPTRTVAVVAVDDGVETRRWTVHGAYIREVSYSDFDTSSFEMIAERYVIGYEDIDETWSTMDDE